MTASTRMIFPKSEKPEKKRIAAYCRVSSASEEQLHSYDEIWEISVAGVAKKYDIPYAQLMKQVKEAAIPIPPSGYWTNGSFS